MSPVDPESPEGYAYYLQCAVAHLDYLFSAAYLSGALLLNRRRPASPAWTARELFPWRSSATATGSEWDSTMTTFSTPSRRTVRYDAQRCACDPSNETGAHQARGRRSVWSLTARSRPFASWTTQRSIFFRMRMAPVVARYFLPRWRDCRARHELTVSWNLPSDMRWREGERKSCIPSTGYRSSARR
eukprot:scaffold1655_cov247-Pinguiococcus_pyrenoidosus.AAC.27